MPFHAAVFIALSCLLISVLALFTSALRRKYQIFAGHGDRVDLQRISRAHGVSLEHLLPMLLLLLVLELCGADRRLIDGFGIAILGSRLIHLFGFLRGMSRIRLAGMTATYATEVLLAFTVLALAARAAA